MWRKELRGYEEAKNAKRLWEKKCESRVSPFLWRGDHPWTSAPLITPHHAIFWKFKTMSVETENTTASAYLQKTRPNPKVWVETARWPAAQIESGLREMNFATKLNKTSHQVPASRHQNWKPPQGAENLHLQLAATSQCLKRKDISYEETKSERWQN